MSRPYPYNLRALFYADTHHGDRSNGRVQQDMLDAENFITDLAIERKVDWVAFVGDAFKSRNPHDECKTKWLQVRKDRSDHLCCYGIHEIDLVGNHCRWFKSDDSGHVFQALDLARTKKLGHVQAIVDRCSTLYSKDERVLFHCLPAQTTYDHDLWVTDPTKINICLFHGMVKGCSLNPSGTVQASEGIPLDILDRPDFDWVMGGDIHIPQIFDMKNTQGGYVGSTLQLDATDAGEKRGCLIVTFEQGAIKPHIEFVPIPHAELFNLSWDASVPLPDMEPYRGQLLTLKISNSNAVSSVDLDAQLQQVRTVVRHLSPLYEPVLMTKTTTTTDSTVGDPIEDFGQYLDVLGDVPDEVKERLTSILRKEIFNECT